MGDFAIHFGCFTADLVRDIRSPHDDGMAIANLSAVQFVNNRQVHKDQKRGSPATNFGIFFISTFNQ